MKISIIIALLTLPLTTLSQFEWLVTDGGNQQDFVHWTEAVGQHIYTIGTFKDTTSFAISGSEADIFIEKRHRSGNLIWLKIYEGEAHEIITDFFVDDTENIYVAGYTNDTIDFDPTNPGIHLITPTIGTKSFVLKLNSLGETQFAQSLGNNTMRIETITIDNDGNIIYAGLYWGQNVDLNPNSDTLLFNCEGGMDVFITKVDTTFNHLWTKVYGSFSTEYAHHLATDDENNIFVIGQASWQVDIGSPQSSLVFSPSSGQIELFLFKITPDGTTQWYKHLNNNGLMSVNEFQIDNENNFYIAGTQSNDILIEGTTIEIHHNNNAGYVMKIRDDGHFLWGRSFSNQDYTEFNDFCLGPNNDIYIAGRFSGIMDFDSTNTISELSSISSIHGSYVLMLNNHGNFQWAELVDSDELVKMTTISVNGFDEVFVGGHYQTSIHALSPSGTTIHPTYGLIDMFHGKLDNNLLSSTSQEDGINIHLYPNPTNGDLKIDTDANVTEIEVLSLNGLLVESIPFSHHSAFQLEAGVYFIRLKNGTTNLATKRIVFQ